VPFNPAASVRGPRYTTKKGKTPVLSADEARVLLDSIKVSQSVVQDDGSEKEERKWTPKSRPFFSRNKLRSDGHS
jgi:hypothetical protein